MCILPSASALLDNDRAVIDDLLTRLQQDGTRTVVRVPVVHHGAGSRLMDVRDSALK